MKKNFLTILAVLISTSTLMGCSGKNDTQNNISTSASVGYVSPKFDTQNNISTSAPVGYTSPNDLQDNTFSQEDYQKLSALQFDGYETMTISEYQNKVWELTDTTEYRELLERFFTDKRLYQMRDSDETAAYLFYVLQPLMAENWQERSFIGDTNSDLLNPAENATLEYTYTLSILNADHVRVRDYFFFGREIREEVLQPVLCNRTQEELRNEVLMREKIDSYLNEELAYMQTPDLSATIEYVYLRPCEEDYRSLLTLKTPDYQSRTLADFNAELLNWANEDGERMERVARDIVRNEVRMNLNSRETSFVTCTVFLSYVENGGYARNCVNESLPLKTIEENGCTARCSLNYQISYCISDPKSVTVGERDDCISKMRTAVFKFWDETDMEDLLQLNEQDVSAKLQIFAKACSTGNVTISVDEEQIQFERMDERQS